MGSPALIRTMGRQLVVDDLSQLGASPAARSDEAVAARKRQDATAHSVDVALDARSPGLAQDRLHDGQEVPRAMIDLSGKQPLLFLARSQRRGLCQQRLAETSIAMANLSAPIRSTSALATTMKKTMVTNSCELAMLIFPDGGRIKVHAAPAHSAMLKKPAPIPLINVVMMTAGKKVMY
jgi:hypothetical protein